MGRSFLSNVYFEKKPVNINHGKFQPWRYFPKACLASFLVSEFHDNGKIWE